MKYIEIGNENGGSAYNDRYALFYDAIKTNYPDVHIIADNWGGLPASRPVEISDEHYYSDPTFFMANATKYDGYSRNGPKIYVGEYAVTTGAGNGNLIGALGEAAFMTGLERNADVVALASYAPLFANLNNKNWNPDLIYFNNSQVYGTPSYYVQKMFSANRGDMVLPLTIAVTGSVSNNAHGAIGLGSWNTSVQYSNVVVTSNGVTLYQSDFTSGASGWRVFNGTWSTSGGVYQQTAITTDCRSTTGTTNWASYTISVRARKVSGNEGFLILFNWLDDNNWTWFNVGGWNNTQTAVEQMVNGTKSIIGQGIPGSVQTGAWYDLRMVLTGPRIQCYINNTLTLDVNYPTVLPLYASCQLCRRQRSDYSQGGKRHLQSHGDHVQPEWPSLGGIAGQPVTTDRCQSVGGKLPGESNEYLSGEQYHSQCRDEFHLHFTGEFTFRDPVPDSTGFAGAGGTRGRNQPELSRSLRRQHPG